MIVKTRQKWYLWHCLARLKKKLGLLDTSLHVVRMASDCHLYPEIRCVISLLDVISILHRASLVIVRMDQEWIKNGRGKRFRQMEKPLQRLHSTSCRKEEYRNDDCERTQQNHLDR